MSDISDILYVEDDIDYCEIFRKYLEFHKLSGSAVKSYKGLKDVLESGVNARLYVIDDDFPHHDMSKKPRMTAKDAIELIRRLNPDSKIVIFSWYTKLLALKNEMNVDYVYKHDGLKPLFNYYRREILRE